jgi:PAS domain-containing protein
MNFLAQCERWATELQSLDSVLRRAGDVPDSVELKDQIQCYRNILSSIRDTAAARANASRRGVLPSRRSIDLLAYPCLETDTHGMIRRANQAASRFLNMTLPLMSGQPLLVFIAKDDRRSLLQALSRLKRTKGLHTGAWLVRCKPLFDASVLTCLTAERLEDPQQEFVGIMWRLSREAIPDDFMG